MTPRPAAPAPTKARRKLWMDDLDALSRELDRIEAAERAGKLQANGQRTPGAIFDHLAKFMRWSFEGFPFSAPLPMRIFGPLLTKTIIKRPFPTGVNIGKKSTAMAWDDAMTFDGGMAELRREIARLAPPGVTPPGASPVFGRMSRDEWIQLHLRHAGLHLGFLHPGETTEAERAGEKH